jgi:transforming growth factor-beta-induced protein
VPDLSTLVSAVVAGDLVDTLSNPDAAFTVFAPTNDGFGKLPAGTVDTLMKPENKAQLVDILTYHVLPAQVLSTDLKFFQRAQTVEGKNLHIFKNSRGVYVSPDGKDFKTVTAADNLATNGVAHIIDGVLLPPADLSAAPAAPEVNIVELAQSVDDLSTLVAAVVAGDLVETLSNPDASFTVFAPTNEAFGALPEGTLDTLLKPENKDQLVDILTYHVLPSQVLSKDLKFFQRVQTVEGKNLHIYKNSRGVYVSPDGKDFKTVTAADNLATNGVAHIIDGVLLPPAGEVSLSAPEMNIVELAQSVDDLSTLVAAVVAGDLVETLSNPDASFTVFAPTNEAFGALPDGTLDSLLKPENKDQLVDILTFHVLPTQVLSKDLKAAQKVQTVEGKALGIFKKDGRVYVTPDGKDYKQVTAADNLATNGVAHIIDGVLLPPSTIVV